MLLVNWARVLPFKWPLVLAAVLADDLIMVIWLWTIRRCSWQQHCLGLASAVRFTGTLITSSGTGYNLWIYKYTNPLSAGLLMAGLAGWAPRSARAAVVALGVTGIISYYVVGYVAPATHVFADLSEVVLAAFVLSTAIITLAETSMPRRLLWGPVVFACLGTFWYWGSNGIANAFANPVYETNPADLRLLFNVRNAFDVIGAVCMMAAMPIGWRRWRWFRPHGMHRQDPMAPAEGGAQHAA